MNSWWSIAFLQGRAAAGPATPATSTGGTMRFFKHGDSLAIVLPESLRKSSGAREGDEYEFLQLEPGVFLLVSRPSLEGMARAGVVAELAKRISEQEKGAGAGKGEIQGIEPAGAAGIGPEKLLETRGYLVIDREAEAKEASVALEKKIRGGEVFVVRGFDKKFYIVSRQFYSSFSPRIAKAIAGKQAAASDIAAGLKLNEQACTAILQIMKDQGEVIEKRRGVFELVK